MMNADPILLDRPVIDFFILADRAEAINGKMYIMGGGWERTIVQDVRMPVLVSFALGVLVPWSDTERAYAVRIRVEGSQDQRVVGPAMQAEIVANPTNGIRRGIGQRISVAVPVLPMLFPALGEYQATAEIVSGDQHIERSIHFWLDEADMTA